MGTRPRAAYTPRTPRAGGSSSISSSEDMTIAARFARALRALEV